MGIPSKLDKHLTGSSILLWQINLLKQSLNVTMHAGWADFPHDIAKLMKDPAYRESVVRKSDLEPLNEALSFIRKGVSAQTVFYVQSRGDLSHWCLLVGNAQEGQSAEIYGSLVCVDINLIAGVETNDAARLGDLTQTYDTRHHEVSETRLDLLSRKLTGSRNLFHTLQTICEWGNSETFEALLFSDVQQSKGKVLVHGAGVAFPDLQQGRSYPFEGTIAEMIVSLDLDHVVVDDTMESLKPIDWALFVPHGIRSYFAVPAFEAGLIRGILIFCSSQANHYSEDQKTYFDRIAKVMFSTKDLFEKTQHPGSK